MSSIILLAVFLIFISGCASNSLEKKGIGEYWEAKIDHNETTGEINYEINYLGTEPTIKTFIYDLSSVHFSVKGGFGKRKTEGGIKIKMTGYSPDLDLNKERVKLKLTWNDKSEEILLE